MESSHTDSNSVCFGRKVLEFQALAAKCNKKAFRSPWSLEDFILKMHSHESLNQKLSMFRKTYSYLCKEWVLGLSSAQKLVSSSKPNKGEKDHFLYF